jgi:DNA-binding MarR family transcriptional regulator
MMSEMTADLRVSRSTRGTGSRAAGRALYGLLAATVRSQPRDMSLTSLSTLATLEQAGPRRITDLAASEGVMQPSMTALVNALQRSGLVERRPDHTDRRVALVALTSAGSEYIRARRRAGVEAFMDLIDELPAEEADALGAVIPALKHIARLDEERRNRSNGSSRSVAGGSRR